MRSIVQGRTQQRCSVSSRSLFWLVQQRRPRHLQQQSQPRPRHLQQQSQRRPRTWPLQALDVQSLDWPTTHAQLHQHPAPVPWQPQPWRAPGVLGPRPAAASPQAYATYGPPRTTPTYSGHQQHLDPTLLNALNNMHLPGNQEWYMDMGASSHMSSNHDSR
ncbi:hypothetical protein VPH35_042544 [Triticum aestivum]